MTPRALVRTARRSGFSAPSNARPVTPSSHSTFDRMSLRRTGGRLAVPASRHATVEIVKPGGTGRSSAARTARFEP